ncbi:MAG: hypothetical protein NC548_22855 [Lachnospiraceae bacterium]|nr:hypothetical protein [Lachnospiraceae bacterium]
MTLDTETATLPFANEICKNAKQKQNVAIAKPLVYDIGWTISDRPGNILRKENFLVQETFFVPNVFNTAYYKEKRPIYMDLLSRGLITVKTWNDIIEILLNDLRGVDISTAYNAAFDFKKAIPFTEKYISHLYSTDYNEWEYMQRKQCETIANGIKTDAKNEDFLKPIFNLRGEEFPITDLWNIACKKLINIDKYRNYCLKNKYLTASAQYFKSSAETTFQYLMNQYDFTEEHTALSDAEIETAILTKALKKGKVIPEMEAFPFRELGTTYNYVMEKQPKYIDIVIDALCYYLQEYSGSENYKRKVETLIANLRRFKEEM